MSRFWVPALVKLSHSEFNQSGFDTSAPPLHTHLSSPLTGCLCGCICDAVCLLRMPLFFHFSLPCIFSTLRHINRLETNPHSHTRLCMNKKTEAVTNSHLYCRLSSPPSVCRGRGGGALWHRRWGPGFDIFYSTTTKSFLFFILNMFKSIIMLT